MYIKIQAAAGMTGFLQTTAHLTAELNSTCHSLAERIIGEISGDVEMITALTTVIIRNLCPRQEFKKNMYFMTSQCVPYS